MRTAEQVMDLYRRRRGEYATLHGKMGALSIVYNGEARISLEDMDKTSLAITPNLLAQGVDQMAGRVVSTNPMIQFSSMKPGVRKYDRMASANAAAMGGYWQKDRLPLKMPVRARRLVGYAMSPVFMRWDHQKNRPTWNVRHPMEAYPSLDLEPGNIVPNDCIFSYRRTFAYMDSCGYGSYLRSMMPSSRNQNINPDSPVTVVEYVDNDMTMLLATGFFPEATSFAGGDGGNRAVVLEAYQNPCMPVVIPMRLTLDSIAGQFDNMIAMYYHQARLTALETDAVEKGIYPDTYLVSRAGEIGRFIDGPHDGRTGLVNIIAGGDIKEVQSQPGYLTNPTIDRIERAQRLSAGIPAEFGGESGNNIRTGRRGDAVLSAVIDAPVAEMQRMFEYGLEEENRIAMELAKFYDGPNERVMYVGVGNARKPVKIVANENFEQTDHIVSYPAVGSDVNNLVIGLGQRVGLGTMSKETAAELDPFIDNPEVERDRITSEGIEQAVIAGFQRGLADGTIPIAVGAKVGTLVKHDKMELADAITKILEEAQAAAQNAADGGQPPLGAQAAGQALAGEVPAPIQGPNPSQEGLANTLTALRRGSRSVA